MSRLLDQRIRNVFTYHVSVDLRTKIALNQVSRVLQRNDLKIWHHRFLSFYFIFILRVYAHTILPLARYQIS